MGGEAFLSYVYHAPWGLTSQGALYALTWRAYAQARGYTEADLGQVAVAQRAWAALNPGAILRRRITIERSEEHTSELQSRQYLVCRLLLEKTISRLTSSA